MKFPTYEEIIKDKGEEWRTFFEFARLTLSEKYLSDRNLIRLTKGAATIKQSELMIKLLYQDSKENPVGVPAIDTFFRVVDHSDYNLGTWLQGVTYFHEWLQSENRKTSFTKMLGYLQCCEDSPENKEIEHDFIELIKTMIEEHGYVG